MLLAILLSVLWWALGYTAVALWRGRSRHLVPSTVNQQVSNECGAGDVDDEDMARGHRRIGVALRIAREVKLRFNGTPSRTEANWRLCGSYVQDACVSNGITRKTDQWQVLMKARPLVFTPLPEEIAEQQWLNSEYAGRNAMAATGWYSKWRHPSMWWTSEQWQAGFKST